MGSRQPLVLLCHWIDQASTIFLDEPSCNSHKEVSFVSCSIFVHLTNVYQAPELAKLVLDVGDKEKNWKCYLVVHVTAISHLPNGLFASTLVPYHLFSAQHPEQVRSCFPPA